MPVDTGDTAWVLSSAALVLLMTPALGFFYGGLVRDKNVISTIMHSFIIVAIISVQWVLWGYSLAFGPDHGGIIGDLSWFGLRNVGAEPNPDYAPTIPHQTYMIFQGMFAIITPALITGAFAERAKFSTFIVFTLLWATLVYDPVAHWVWAKDGWLGVLGGIGAYDFAGGAVVHINSGVAALAAALVFGRRLGLGKSPMEPHNVPYVVLGAALLWFGWFGFNAGSAVAAGASASNAFVVTNTAAAAAALTWMAMSWAYQGVPSVTGAATGAVAGLVAITPASGFIGAWGLADGYLNILPALFIGIGAGVFCYLATRLRARLGFDDALDVWACHGIGGTWGALATGIFATGLVTTVVGYRGDIGGVIDGHPGQLLAQLAGIAATWAYSFTMTFILLKVLDRVMGLRVSPRQELVGVDLAQHGERAYVG
ncbi:MAG TPA: ammonium transporter [Dehalococcoidia bacterium]|nr:ammonium transporter [Dehalococcoidia bacterium]